MAPVYVQIPSAHRLYGIQARTTRCTREQPVRRCGATEAFQRPLAKEATSSALLVFVSSYTESLSLHVSLPRISCIWILR
ncbi:hypothetical protein ACN42_g8299 [Penicillium freii]|uniref:Uncharacterized protein n=1 Tax=Penicillium freii TaxID=48697 RepID=A0A101ME21_PENFR|nr:hypothetical protein ACN42_g8299 [Penicillium freii]